jgi:hypothetical protein
LAFDGMIQRYIIISRVWRVGYGSENMIRALPKLGDRPGQREGGGYVKVIRYVHEQRTGFV